MVPRASLCVCESTRDECEIFEGTSQTRFYRFEGSRMFYVPVQGSTRVGRESLTRRLTLERL